MTPELDAMNVRVQEWLGFWKPRQGRERCKGFESSAGYKVITTVEYEDCPDWTAETAMRALKQVTDHESVQDGEMIPCYHEPELWACGKHWKCRMDSWLDEVADPDPVTAVLRACDKLREKEK